jgi:hypothetical protein
MPNVKIYVDEAVLEKHRPALMAALVPLRTVTMERLNVPLSACQLVLIAVNGLPDQPAVNVEIHIMPHPARTRENLETLGAMFQQILGRITGTRIAFRCAQLDPASYVALK